MDETNILLEEQSELDDAQIVDPAREQADLERKYLSFYLDKQMYGISIIGVIEIQKLLDTTPMPELPYYVKGIINLRGSIIPIIDVNLRFGREERPPTDRTCIIIVKIDDTDVGFIVDEVAEVLTVEDEDIAPPPVFASEARGRYVTGIAKLDNGMMLILDCWRILSDCELGAFSQ